MSVLLALAALFLPSTGGASYDQDDKCLIYNADLPGGNILTVNGVTSVFNCKERCSEYASCYALVWVTRREMCLLKGVAYGPVSRTTWIASPTGGAGVAVVMSCLAAGELAMNSLKAEMSGDSTVKTETPSLAATSAGTTPTESTSTGKTPTETTSTETTSTESTPTEATSTETTELPETSDWTTASTEWPTPDDTTPSEWGTTTDETTTGVSESTEESNRGSRLGYMTKEVDKITTGASHSSDRSNWGTEIVDEEIGEATETIDEEDRGNPLIEVIDKFTVTPSDNNRHQIILKIMENYHEIPNGGGQYQDRGYQYQIVGYSNDESGWAWGSLPTVQWLQQVVQPVLPKWIQVWWADSSEQEPVEEEDASVPTSSSPSFSSSSSPYDGLVYSSSSPPALSLSQSKLLDLLNRIQQWTFTSVKDALVAIVKAFKENPESPADDQLACYDSAKSCGVHLCGVDVVANMCKKTCGICPSTLKVCQDTYSATYCSFSAAMGYCKEHEGIAMNCRDSCDKCPEDCVDYDVEFCEMYGSFHCWNEDVRNMCIKSCFLC